MSLSFLTVLVLNFVYIAALPRVFFRADGKLNLMWWLTGFPLGLAPLSVVLQSRGMIPEPFALSTNPYLETAGALLCIVSYGLISYTLGTHRIPLALWHQENDAPKQIVTWGAYKRVRHPFYASFLIALVAALVAAPNALTLLSLVYGYVILNATAEREEKRLSSSEFGQEYIDYTKVSGRFFPKI